MQEHFEGKWGVPRHSLSCHLPTAISVRDFRKFKDTTPKNGRECVIFHRLLVTGKCNAPNNSDYFFASKC